MLLHWADVALTRAGHCRNAEGFVGLKNGSATCYMNAVFQQLFMAPGVRMAVLGEPEEPEAGRRDSVFYQMQVHPTTARHITLSMICPAPGPGLAC